MTEKVMNRILRWSALPVIWVATALIPFGWDSRIQGIVCTGVFAFLVTTFVSRPWAGIIGAPVSIPTLYLVEWIREHSKIITIRKEIPISQEQLAKYESFLSSGIYQAKINLAQYEEKYARTKFPLLELLTNRIERDIELLQAIVRLRQSFSDPATRSWIKEFQAIAGKIEKAMLIDEVLKRHRGELIKFVDDRKAPSDAA